MNIFRLSTLYTLVLVSLLATGCASSTKTQPGILVNLILEAENRPPGQADGPEGKAIPAYFDSYILQNQQSGLRDQVLLNMRAGVSAMKEGDYHITRRLMEDAHHRIETIYADNKAAKAARSNYVEEANKDFKGEPYERAMVGYYLGLSDMLSGDLQSAKSSFGWGEYQDTLSASEEYQSDMDSLVFLRGWAKHCAGETHSANADFNQSGMRPGHADNVLILVESGKAPIKYATGKHSEKLKFRAADYSSPASIRVYHDNEANTPQQIENLAYQASTRGGRPVDAILAGKAEFKDTSQDVADGALAGAMMSSSLAQASAYSGDFDMANDFAAAGAVMGLFSIVASISSEQTMPEADTRQWNNLPQFIHAHTMNIVEAKQPKVRIYTNNQPVDLALKPTGNCYLAWHRVDA